MVLGETSAAELKLYGDEDKLELDDDGSGTLGMDKFKLCEDELEDDSGSIQDSSSGSSKTSQISGAMLETSTGWLSKSPKAFR
jgi:hypothetical protein